MLRIEYRIWCVLGSRFGYIYSKWCLDNGESGMRGICFGSGVK